MNLLDHTELFSNIRWKYGNDVLQASRRYVNTGRRISRQYQHLAFNHRCMRYQVVPMYLCVRPLVPTSEGRRIARKCSMGFLRAQIGKNHQLINQLWRELSSRRLDLLRLMMPDDFSALENERHLVESREMERCKSRQKGSLRNCGCAQGRSARVQKRAPLEDGLEISQVSVCFPKK